MVAYDQKQLAHHKPLLARKGLIAALNPRMQSLGWSAAIRLRFAGDYLGAAALLLALVKSIQFAIDSQVLFYDDSGAFLLNALGYAFIPERSFVYSALIRVFSVSTHSLRAIVAMQMVMGGITAWLLAFILLRFFSVRPWIAILVALAFAFDPVQIVHEHLMLTETTAMLAVALFLATAVQYLRTFSSGWLVTVSVLGIVLVSLRLVYVPVVLACAVLLPLGAYFRSSRREPRTLAIALMVSCSSTLLLQIGFRDLTGRLAGREPAYQYRTGDFMVTLVAPLIEPEDAKEVRVAEAVRAQNQGGLPLSDADFRTAQMWTTDGFVTRLHTVFHGDQRAANRAEDQLARAAIMRDPWGFVRLGFHTYLEYWRDIPQLDRILAKEHGTPPTPVVPENGVRMISALFGVDVSNQHTLYTLSRRYHTLGRYWNVFLLASPLLAGLTLWPKPLMTEGAAPLFVWGLLLFAATFWGASEAAYRYLHPFSFTGLAAAAALADKWLPKSR
ncbi:MAG: hypothetical protein ABSB35_28195 [Bryobacteraceae bacterium]